MAFYYNLIDLMLYGLFIHITKVESPAFNLAQIVGYVSSPSLTSDPRFLVALSYDIALVTTHFY